jgi:transposase
LAEIPIDAPILDTDAAPVYQQIAPKAVQLQQLGMSNSAIAKRLKITDKTVAKAVAWLWRVQHRPGGHPDNREKLSTQRQGLLEGKNA